MTLGTSVRQQVRNLISDKNIRTTITRKPTKRTIGEGGGYETGDEVSSGSSTFYAVPSRYYKHRKGNENFGDLKEGEIKLLIADNTTVNSNDILVYNGQEYTFKVSKETPFNEIIAVKSLILTKRKDSNSR